MPLVMGPWRGTGIETSLTSAATRRAASPGERMPAMSLMQIESAPICSSSRASLT